MTVSLNDLRDHDLIRQDAESAMRTCELAWARQKRAVVTVGAGFLYSLAESCLSLLEESDRLAAQARWRSEPAIAEALDDLDEYVSALSQGYAHSKAEMPEELAKLSKLASSLALRVRSQFRVTALRGE